MGGFRYEPRLHHEITASDKLPGKREYVAALAQAEVVPELFRHVHTERGCSLVAVRRTIPQLVSASSDRLMPQPCEEVRKGYPLHVFNVRPFHTRLSVDDELYAHTPLAVRLLRVATPQQAFPEIGEQGDTVCHIKLHIKRQRTAIDESVPVVQCGSVIQHLLPPIHRLISGESRNTPIDKK